MEESHLILTWGQVIAILVPQVVGIATLILYMRVEIASLKTWKKSFEEMYRNDKQTIEKGEQIILTDLKDFRDELARTKELFSGQLYDLNSKVTESATIIKMKFLNESTSK